MPHYAPEGCVVLPASRHGTGILSLQTFVLLLEVGRERRKQGLPFILALEEPELHVPPGLQRKLVAQAVAISAAHKRRAREVLGKDLAKSAGVF